MFINELIKNCNHCQITEVPSPQPGLPSNPFQVLLQLMHAPVIRPCFLEKGLSNSQVQPTPYPSLRQIQVPMPINLRQIQFNTENVLKLNWSPRPPYPHPSHYPIHSSILTFIHYLFPRRLKLIITTKGN